MVIPWESFREITVTQLSAITQANTRGTPRSLFPEINPEKAHAMLMLWTEFFERFPRAAGSEFRASNLSSISNLPEAIDITQSEVTLYHRMYLLANEELSQVELLQQQNLADEQAARTIRHAVGRINQAYVWAGRREERLIARQRAENSVQRYFEED